MPRFALFLIGVLSNLAAQNALIVGRISSILGDVDVLDLDGKNPQKAKIGFAITDKQQIRTGSRSKVLLSLVDGSRLEIFDFSVINIKTISTSETNLSLLPIVVRMLSGKIRLQVQNVTFAEKKFFLKTPTLVAAVRGTEFSCIATLKEARLAVHSGNVEVANRSPSLPNSVILGPRQEVRVLEGRDPDRLRFLPPEILENYLEHYEITKAQKIIRRIRETDTFFDKIFRKKSF